MLATTTTTVAKKKGDATTKATRVAKKKGTLTVQMEVVTVVMVEKRTVLKKKTLGVEVAAATAERKPPRASCRSTPTWTTMIFASERPAMLMPRGSNCATD